MKLLAGQIFTADSRSLIYESGDDVETISYIIKGSITVDNKFGQKIISAGNFAAFEDIYGGFYSCNYTVEAGTQILPITANSPSSLVQFLNANIAIHDKIAFPICKLLVQLHNIYVSLHKDICELYANIEKTYSKYLQYCEDLHIQNDIFMIPHDAIHYEFDKLDFANNYNIMASLSSTLEKANAVYKANGVKFLKIQSTLLNSIFTTYDDMVFYLRSLLTMFVGKTDNCLFALVARLCQKSKKADSVYLLLENMRTIVRNIDTAIEQHTGLSLDIDYNRVDFFFSIADDTDDNDYNSLSFDDDLELNLDIDYSSYDEITSDSFINNANDDNVDDNDNDNEYDLFYDEMPDFSNTLKQICDFAGLSNRYDEFNRYIEKFISLPDKESRDDDVRIFRKNFTTAYFELYEETFIQYARSKERNRIVEIFLDFGFLDERLLSDAQIEFICTIPPLNKTSPCKVFRMTEWLMRIYTGEEIPSKNEFDLEYVDYIRERKKNEALSPEMEKRLLSDNELKVRYEIHNMLKYNCRLLNGKLLSFFPMLHMGNFERSIENMLLTSEIINEQVKTLVGLDYSIFYREMLFADVSKKIEKESIQKEIYPIFILFPVAGINSIMWQEISGKRSNSEGRIFLPAFFEGKIEDTFLNIFAKYHWELCKTIQGGAWNNISIPSLTSEYSDYIQFYRKNKDLSPEKKELVKGQITRCRNNLREIFATDFVTWMKYESTGSIRLNKIARRILATYCPFSKEVRERIKTQPIFEEAMSKYYREKQKKCKEISLRYKALEKKGAVFTKELMDTHRFYEEL